jgi:hypothetical protein
MNMFIELALNDGSSITLAKSHIESLMEGDGHAFVTLVITTSGRGYETTMTKAEIKALLDTIA